MSVELLLALGRIINMEKYRIQHRILALVHPDTKWQMDKNTGSCLQSLIRRPIMPSGDILLHRISCCGEDYIFTIYMFLLPCITIDNPQLMLHLPGHLWPCLQWWLDPSKMSWAESVCCHSPQLLTQGLGHSYEHLVPASAPWLV